MSNKMEQDKNDLEKLKSQENQGIRIEDICKKVTLVTGLFSLILFWVCKYISLGRIEYFQFDIKYYDYSLSYVSKGVFFIYVGFIAVGVIFSIIMMEIGAYLEKKCGDKVKNFEVVYFFVTILLMGAVIFFLTKNTISYGGLNKELGLFNSGIFVFIYTMIYVFNINRHNCEWVAGIVGLLLICVGAFALKKNEYSNAREQDRFEIIKEENNIDDKPCQYVVISSNSERYSAYLCEIVKKDNEVELKIIKNVHKYFSCNGTETIEMKFSKIQYDELSYEEIGIVSRKK